MKSCFDFLYNFCLTDALRNFAKALQHRSTTVYGLSQINMTWLNCHTFRQLMHSAGRRSHCAYGRRTSVAASWRRRQQDSSNPCHLCTKLYDVKELSRVHSFGAGTGHPTATRLSSLGCVHTCNVPAYRNTVSCGRDSWPRNVSKVGYVVTLRACSVRCRYSNVASKGW